MNNYFWQSCNIEGTGKVLERYAAVTIDLAVAAVDEAEPASALTQTTLKANSSLANSLRSNKLIQINAHAHLVVLNKRLHLEIPETAPLP